MRDLGKYLLTFLPLSALSHTLSPSLIRTRRINDVNQDILWIARDSLLSIAAYFVAHTLPTDTIITNRRSPLDTPSLVVRCDSLLIIAILNQRG